MTNQNKHFQGGAFITLLVINVTIGFVASLFTRPEIHGWYASLQKPWFNPPPWVFGPAWTIIYVLIAIAAYCVWRNRNGYKDFTTAAVIYFVQLALNCSWSVVFFGMHQAFWAFIVILALWASIILNMIWFSKFSRTGAWLMLPYLLWVSFASVLNLNIYLLNR